MKDERTGARGRPWAERASVRCGRFRDESVTNTTSVAGRRSMFEGEGRTGTDDRRLKARLRSSRPGARMGWVMRRGAAEVDRVGRGPTAEDLRATLERGEDPSRLRRAA